MQQDQTSPLVKLGPAYNRSLLLILIDFFEFRVHDLFVGLGLCPASPVEAPASLDRHQPLLKPFVHLFSQFMGRPWSTSASPFDGGRIISSIALRSRQSLR